MTTRPVRWPLLFLLATLIAMFWAVTDSLDEFWFTVELLRQVFAMDVQVGGEG